MGSLDNIRIEDVAAPSPGPGEVRIRTSAVALGFVDGLIAAGLYQMKPALPFVPGGEIGGEAKQARFSLFEQVELRRLSGPLVTPFRFEQAKDALEATGKRDRLGKLAVLM